MRPVVTPTEMAAIDAEAPESMDELIDRAGWATARAALELLGSGYGKRVAILAGKGNNGADGRRAVPHLERVGVRCDVFDVPARPPAGPSVAESVAPRRPERYDLIIDACYGTGLRRSFDRSQLPFPIGGGGRPPVLAVDVPSGVDGATGELRGEPIPAAATVTFAAPKPGLLLSPGRAYVGRLVVADIGLDCSRATIGHLELGDLDRWPARDPDDHKWRRAVLTIGGGRGMTGAPGLVSRAALRAGAGYATLAIPGAAPDSPGSPIEAVGRGVGEHWADELLDRARSTVIRHGAAVVGPGLVDNRANRRAVARWWTESPVPTVFDAGALTALAAVRATPTGGIRGTRRPGGPGPSTPSSAVRHVLTPHDGEFARLAGRPPGTDRIGAARWLADELGAVVLTKGPTTVVAAPGGAVLISTAGDARLATAGSGDVLAGLIGAGLAAGLDPLDAAGLAAELHGRAALRGRAVGLVASDLPELAADVLSSIAGRRSSTEP